MKKSTIWIIACIMGVTLLTLLYLQFRYFDEVYNMRQEQFGESVTRSLSQAAENLELSETQARLDHERFALPALPPSIGDASGTDSADFASNEGAFPLLTPSATSSDSSAEQHSRRMQYQQDLMSDMLSLLYKPSDKTLVERLDVKELDSAIKQELGKNGINLPYHFRVTTSDGREIFRCQDYDPKGEDAAYRQEIFPNDSRAQMGIVYVHFPGMQRFIFAGVRFMLPAIFFTMIVLVMFCITIFTIFRQKRLTEIKNDFINNMTHEFKTPIATVSLAAQMLNDPSVTKNESMLAHLSGIINDETKRLRFQVEKVLQMSMFEKKANTFKKREVDANALIGDVVNTFRIRVESAGGSIASHLDAADANVFVDEMHFTNVIFNLMDNAVKYRNPDKALELNVSTSTKDDKLQICVADNGIGIKKEDVKKVFEKFYRVHTGNRHDVKGFGLGLAYVKNVITNLGGTIHAESEFGHGTRFIITLPIIKTPKL